MSDSQYNDSLACTCCTHGVKQYTIIVQWWDKSNVMGHAEYALVSILLFSVTAAIVLAGMLCVTAMPTKEI